MVAPALAHLVRSYPNIQVELSLSTRLADPIRDGFDLVVCKGKLSDSALTIRPLGSVDSCVFASADYLARRGVPRRPSDLAAHDCILFRAPPRKARWELSGVSASETVMVTGPLRFDDHGAVAAAVVGGAGLGVLPFHFQHTRPDRAAFVRVLPRYIVRGEPAQIVYAAARHVPQRVRLICDAIVAAVNAQCPLAERR